MLRVSWRYISVVLLLIMVAAAVNLAQPPTLGRSNLAACPMEIDEFSGYDVPVEEFVLEELNPSEMLIRTYRGQMPAENIWVVIAYFENARYGAHNPVLCYHSQGWQTEMLPAHELTRQDGDPVEAQLFRVHRRGEERLVMYWWYISETQITGDHRSFLNSMALQGILRGSNYGAFVRVSTPSWPSESAALERLDRFAGQVLDRLPELIPGSERKSD